MSNENDLHILGEDLNNLGWCGSIVELADAIDDIRYKNTCMTFPEKGSCCSLCFRNGVNSTTCPLDVDLPCLLENLGMDNPSINPWIKRLKETSSHRLYEMFDKICYNMVTENNNLKASISCMFDSNTKLKATNDQLLDANTKFKGTNDQLLDVYTKFKDANTKYKVVNDHLEKTVVDLNTKYKDANTKFKDANTKFKNVNDHLERTVVAHKKQIDSLELILSGINNVCLVLKSKNDNLKSDISDVKKHNRRLEERLGQRCEQVFKLLDEKEVMDRNVRIVGNKERFTKSRLGQRCGQVSNLLDENLKLKKVVQLVRDSIDC